MKTIQSFNINTSYLSTAGETRSFTINGDVGCNFSLEVRYINDANIYEWYNFKTRKYSTQEYSLNVTTTTQSYVNTILFPSKSTATQYDLLLLAKENTVHSPYLESRDASGAVDLNNSKGSNSDMLRKIIRQVADGYIRIAPDTSYNSLNATDAFDSLAVTNQQIYVQSNTAGGKINFSISASMADGRALSVVNDVSEVDFYVKKAVTLGDPIVIPGEDVYGYGQTARNTDVVDGVVSNSSTIQINTIITSAIMVAGDRVTGTGIPSSTVLTVRTINPGGSNSKAFEVSEAVSIDNDVTLTFTEPYYRLWECNDVTGLSNGCFLRNTSGVTTIEDSSTIINDYFDYAEAGDDLVLQNYVPGVVRDGSIAASITAEKRVVYLNGGTICVEPAIKKENTGKNLEIYAYNNSTIRNLTGFDIDITNLKTELTPVTTTTTAAVVNSTTVPVLLGHGIMDGDISTVRSSNIVSSSNNDVTVSSIASFTSGGSFAASLTLSQAQTLENGETLTFGTAARQVTVTGDINIKETGDGVTGNGVIDIYLDIDRFLIGTNERTD